MTTRRISRRTVLQGLGSVAIGLPLLEEMLVSTAAAQDAVSSTGSNDPRRERLRRSVLDSVVEPSQFYTSPNSPLGAASKARLSEHLDRIREYEQRAFKLEE